VGFLFPVFPFKKEIVMSRNLSSRHNSFSQPGIAAGQPVVQPRPSRASLVLDAIRAQRAAVKIDGCVALYSALRPSEQKIVERAIASNHYDVRKQPSGMALYVIKQPAPAPAQPAADQPKPKLSKQQRAAAEKELIKQMAEIAAAAKPAAKPKKLRNRHDDLAAARALKGMVTGQ
jgi:hypothetical protein